MQQHLVPVPPVAVYTPQARKDWVVGAGRIEVEAQEWKQSKALRISEPIEIQPRTNLGPGGERALRCEHRGPQQRLLDVVGPERPLEVRPPHAGRCPCRVIAGTPDSNSSTSATAASRSSPSSSR